MRCCWLLAIGLVIAPLCVLNAVAEEATVNDLRRAERAATGTGDEAQATLAALSTAVRVPPSRHVSKPAVAESGRPAAIVRLAKPSPYAPPTAKSEAASLDELAARLVSHSEAGSAPTVIPSDEAPETSRSAIRPATVWTPTEVGDVEEESPAPRVAPVVVADEMPVLQPVQPTIYREPQVMRVAEPQVVRAAEPQVLRVPEPHRQAELPVRTEPPTTVTVKPAAPIEKRESSRAGGGYSNNPLRQGTRSTIISSDVDNPLR